MIYQYTIYPLELIYKTLYLWISGFMGSYGFPLVVLSIVTTILISPLVQWAARLQADEKAMQDTMKPYMNEIKKSLKGAEQHNAIKRLYYRFSYHPIMAFRSAVGIMLQMPFLMAAYYMLSSLPNIKGQTFYFIQDLSKPDALIVGINVLPILMTLINLGSTFTTSNFTRKDKIQASVIAVFFLVLLYDAPSALLIFWTCNNLWGLLLNLAGKVDAIVELQSTISKKISVLCKKFNKTDMIYVMTSMTVCFFVPIDIFLQNTNEFQFMLKDAVGEFLIVGIVCSFVCILVSRWFSDRGRKLYARIVFAAGFMICLQSYMLEIGLGVLDGHEINWLNYKMAAIINLLVWLVVFMIVLVLPKISKKINEVNLLNNIAIFLLVAQCISVGYTSSKVTFPDRTKVRVAISDEHKFELSSQQNVIIFIVDTFDTEYFKDRLIDTPNLYNIFDGFIYLHNAVGSYHTTKGALPQILTNVWYKNEDSYDDYLKRAWKQTSFWKQLKENNYDNRVFTDSHYMQGAECVDNAVIAPRELEKIFLGKYYKLTMFRMAPIMFKQLFSINTSEFDKYLVLKNKDNNKEIYFIDDAKFYNEFNNSGLTIQKRVKSCRIYHLRGIHWPYTLDTQVNDHSLNGEKTSKNEQADAIFTILRTFFDEMKKNNIYDSSMIIVMADHGYPDQKKRVPLLAVKPMHKRGKLVISENPVSYKGLHTTILQGIGIWDRMDSENFFVTDKFLTHRNFYWFNWDEKSNKDFMPKLIEYVIIGNSENHDDWHVTGKVFFGGAGNHNKYKLGTELLFNKNNGDGIYNYVVAGFSTPEENFIWTDGKEAVLNFNIVHNEDENLLLKATLAPYLGNGFLLEQEVNVEVNGVLLNTWHIKKTGTYVANIPYDIINDNNVIVRFMIKHPLSPKEVGNSNDGRELGVAVSKIVLRLSD